MSIALNRSLDGYFTTCRSYNVKTSAKLLLNYLNEELSNDLQNGIEHKDAGWVRSKVLFDALVRTGEIPYSTQFFRILESLEDLKIIEKSYSRPGKRGKGSKPVYYRINDQIDDIPFMTEEELRSEIRSLRGRLRKYESEEK